MTRALIADPELPNKVAAGHPDRIRPCVGANMCIDGIYSSGASYCVHNPSTGHELQLPHRVGTASFRKRVVVGGGLAGLEAAHTLGERGHEVIFFEASDQLGGQVNLAVRFHRRRDLIGIIDWRVEELKRLGVRIELNHYAEPLELLDLGYDVVIVATGGLPDVDVATGSDLATDTWDVMSGAIRPVGDVIVYDDNEGNAALDATEILTGTARSIQLVTPERTTSPGVGGSLTMVGCLQMLADQEAPIIPAYRLHGIKRAERRLKATFAVDGAHKTLERFADTIVIEHGTAPGTSVYDGLISGSVNGGEIDLHGLLALSPQRPIHNPGGRYRLYRVGDAVASRDIQTAVPDSFRLCSAI